MVPKRDLNSGRLPWLILFFVIQPLMTLAQDCIIFRDGNEKQVRIKMVGSETTLFVDAKQKKAKQETVDNSTIYMIKYEKRGNVFLSVDGQRFSGEGDGKIPSGASAIYLLIGDEIIAYNVTLDGGNVNFYKSKKNNAVKISIPTEKIFLIKYPDGTKDLLNDFEELKRKEAKAIAEKKRLDEEAELAKIKSNYPKDAIIISSKGVEIKAILLSEEEGFATYKRCDMKKSPTFYIDRSNIREIITKN